LIELEERRKNGYDMVRYENSGATIQPTAEANKYGLGNNT